MSNISELKELARGIVLAQGNTFIKELLRANKVKIGVTKTDFLTNLNTAIEDGILTEEIFNDWLNRVEGWGNQHAYIFRISNTVADRDLWRNPESVRKLAADVGLGEKWNVSPSRVFANERKLVGVYSDDISFRLLWYEGHPSLVRDKDMDKSNETIGLDRYDFHAYRHRTTRTVTRFDWPRGSRYAALLMQTPWNQKDHEEIKNEAFSVVTKFIERRHLQQIDISKAITQLDQETVDPTNAGAGFTSESARLESGGAYVNFGSTTDRGYSSVAAVREVRIAVPIDQFNGDRGIFTVRNNPNFTISRKDSIRIVLRGDFGWVKISKMCERKDIWNILSRIAEMVSNV